MFELEFIVKKDFSIGKNLKAFLRVHSIYYDVLKDEWLIEFFYFLNKETAQFYRVAEFLRDWCPRHPYLINENSWLWLRETYLDQDLSKLLILKEKVKLVSDEYMYFGTPHSVESGRLPLIVNEFWYNKTKSQVIEWVRAFIIKNRKLFQINEMIESSGDDEEFKAKILEPVLEKIKGIK